MATLLIYIREKYKRLELGGREAYDRSSDYAAVVA
jgi:hypothetical protein